MAHKIHTKGLWNGWAIHKEIIKALVPRIVLQLIDDRKAAIVQDEQDVFD